MIRVESKISCDDNNRGVTLTARLPCDCLFGVCSKNPYYDTIRISIDYVRSKYIFGNLRHSIINGVSVKINGVTVGVTGGKLVNLLSEPQTPIYGNDELVIYIDTPFGCGDNLDIKLNPIGVHILGIDPKIQVTTEMHLF